jgi:hypothetical protein
MYFKDEKYLSYNLKTMINTAYFLLAIAIQFIVSWILYQVNGRKFKNLELKIHFLELSILSLSSDEHNMIGKAKQPNSSDAINQEMEQHEKLTPLQAITEEKLIAKAKIQQPSILLPVPKIMGTKEVSEAISNNEIHLVCTARINGTIWKAAITHISEPDYVSSLNKLTQINTQCKIDTLFPLRNISMLPLRVYDGTNTMHERDEFKKYISDCLNLNETKVRCPVMLFAFDKLADFNYLLAKDVLAEILVQETNLCHTKQVYYSMV